MKRFQVIAPNGNKCSAIWANEEKTMLQTWSGKRKRWESFSVIYCKVDKNCILDMATDKNPITRRTANCIKLKNGMAFVRKHIADRFFNNAMIYDRGL